MVTVKPATKTQGQQQKKRGETAYDLIIVGAGLAGLTCALYAAQKKMRVALVEAQLPGGKLLRETHCVLPGFSGKGFLLVSQILDQLKAFPLLEQIQGQATQLHAVQPLYTCTLDDGHILHGRALVLAIGALKKSPLLQGLVALTEEGYVVAGEDTQTSVPGVYAIGDVREKPLRHLLSTAADGALAGLRIAEYLR